jgi:hypothetical protein
MHVRRVFVAASLGRRQLRVAGPVGQPSELLSAGVAHLEAPAWRLERRPAADAPAEAFRTVSLFYGLGKLGKFPPRESGAPTRPIRTGFLRSACTRSPDRARSCPFFNSEDWAKGHRRVAAFAMSTRPSNDRCS